MNTSIFKTSRRLLIIAAYLLFMINITTTSIFAYDSGECGNGVTWTLDNGALVIEGNGSITDYSEYQFAPWYNQRNDITKVIVKDGVTGVGNMSFYDCGNLTQVTLSDSVNRIGESAFLKCDDLETIFLGNSMAAIGDYAFKLCTSLKGISLPNSLQAIGYESFFMCESIKSITIPSSVYYLGESAFAYCDSLLQAVINASIVELPTWSFYGCTNLTSVIFSSSIREIGNNAFYDCDSLIEAKSSASQDVCDNLSEQIKENTSSFIEVEKTISKETNVTSKQESNNSSQSNVLENKDVIISGSVENNKDNNNENNDVSNILDVIIKNEDAWNDVIDKIDEQLGKGNTNDSNNSLDVNIYIQDDCKISGDLFNQYAGEDINININTNTAIFTVDASSLNPDEKYNDFTIGYKLERIDKLDESIISAIGNAEAYYLKLDGNFDFDVTVRIKLDHSGYASLYQKNQTWSLIQSTRIDKDGYVSFYLNSFDRLTKYLLAINVETIDQNSILLQESEYDQYNGLVDEHGNKYEITGVKSSWGISLGQFSLILIFVLVFIVSIIGVIMYVLYKRNQMIEMNNRRSKNRKAQK